MMCKLKGRMEKGGHYDVQMKGCMVIMMCKLKGWIDKGGPHDVEMKRWSQKGAL